MGYNPDQDRDDNGRWAGGGESLASHSDSIGAHHSPAIASSVLETVRNNPEGFSVTLSGHQPSDGYMVALQGQTQIVHADALKGPGGATVIHDYVRTHAHALSQPGAHIGGWTSGNKVYLDVSQRFSSEGAAIEAGKQRNQIAIYDVKHGKEIATGGTGH